MKPFTNGARVCFVGDSITHKGLFLKHIVAYYRKKFPTSGVEFYNCGIAGGSLGNTIRVYEQDIAIYDPTHIVLMIGVNDSRRTYLSRPRSTERYEKLLEGYQIYGHRLEQFYQMTMDRNVELILCTPMPYAEYIESQEETLPGGHALMQRYAAYVRDFARTHRLPLCDYHAAATQSIQSANLYAPDRVHPNEEGHVLMAKTFLASQGIPWEAPDQYPPEIEEWYAVTKKLRNVVATEFLTVPNYIHLNDAERMTAVQSTYDTRGKEGTFRPDDYVDSLIKAYLTEKPRQAEYLAYVKNFMKSQSNI